MYHDVFKSMSCVGETSKAVVAAKQWQELHKYVFFCLGREMSDGLLEQCTNISFCAELGNADVNRGLCLLLL